MKTLQVFISSPGDVFEERAIANRVIDRLQSEYIGRLVLEPVLWEHEPLVATSTFQHQIVKPSETDVVIAILWSRLGTKLPPDFVREDGSRYDSGTEYEFEEAIEGFRKNGKPDLLVYRKTAPPSVRLDDEKELMERLEQKKKLDVFIEKWFHDRTEGTLKAAFHSFESPSDFEVAVENHLRKLIDRKIPKSEKASSAARAVWKQGSPFRGLASFHFEHAPVFFGRTRAVSDVLQALRKQADDDRSFVLILGMSGGGKSSVARAGVLPMLTRPGVIEGVTHWRRAVFRPTDIRGHLFRGLASALLRDHALPSLDADGNGQAELAQILRESPQAAVSLIKSALNQEASDAGSKGDSRLALVIDQMEEMYTQADVGDEDREAFSNVLDAFARCGRIWIVGTLRSDFYPRLAKLPKLAALKDGAGQYDLMPPNASEIGQMIRLPTRAAGLSFEEDPATNARLDDMLRDAAAEHPEVLPLLQFTLEELYQRRTADGMLTLEAYRALGGVEGSLAQRAETVFKDLPDDVELELPKVLNALISVEHDGHETIGRKRSPMDGFSGKTLQIIETFVANRLFVTELGDDGKAVVTVAHEALLWHWPRIKDWVEQNRENLRVRGRVAQAAERWASDGRPNDLLLPTGKPLDEAESLLEQDLELREVESAFIKSSLARAKGLQRLKYGVVAALAILGCVALVSAYFATQQRDLALKAQTNAEIKAETALQTQNFLLDMFRISTPGAGVSSNITAAEIMDRGAARIEGELNEQPETKASLMETIGSVYTSLGQYPEASALLQKALEIRRGLPGNNQLGIAGNLQRLGSVLKLQADYEPAEKAYIEALSIRRARLGDNNVDTAATAYQLADLLTRMGRYKEAEPLLREALETQVRLLGEETPEVAQSLEGLALNLFDQGNYDEPLPLMRQAVDLRRKLPGTSAVDKAEAINNLGFLLGEAGDYKESAALFAEALELKREIYEGKDHPEIAMGLNNVAFALHDQGDYAAAEEMYREAIAMQRRLLGEQHPDVAMGLNNLAFLLYDKGDADRAMELSRESLAMYRATVGDDHPSVARGMNNLGLWMMEKNDYEAAEPLLREALTLRQSLLGDDHSSVAGTQTLLANLLIDTQRYEEALPLAQQAREINSKALSAEHWRTAAAASAEAAALAGLGKTEEARALLVPSVELLEKDEGVPPYYRTTAERWLGNLAK